MKLLIILFILSVGCSSAFGASIKTHNFKWTNLEFDTSTLHNQYSHSASTFPIVVQRFPITTTVQLMSLVNHEDSKNPSLTDKITKAIKSVVLAAYRAGRIDGLEIGLGNRPSYKDGEDFWNHFWGEESDSEYRERMSLPYNP